MADEKLLRKLLEEGYYGAYHLLKPGGFVESWDFVWIPARPEETAWAAPEEAPEPPPVEPVSAPVREPPPVVAPPAPKPEPPPAPAPARPRVVLRPEEARPREEGVSVVVPFRDRPETLVAALRSVFAQDWDGRLEVMVVDDASPAGLPHLPELADGRVKVMRHGERKGPGAARNTGIRGASFSMVLPLDDDDILEEGALSALAAVVRRGHDLVYGDIKTLDVSGEKLVRQPPYDFDLLLETCFMHNTSMFTREAWRRAGGYDEALPGLEDWEFWIRLGSIGICGEKVQRAVVTYRLSPDGRSRSFSRPEVVSLIKEKHANLFRGERPVGCCGKRVNVNRKVVPQRAKTSATFGAGGLEEIEYVGVADEYPCHGPVTGAAYAFTRELPVRYVDGRDAAEMLNEPVFVRPGEARPEPKMEAPDLPSLKEAGLPVTEVKGISARRAGLLAEAGIVSCEDLTGAYAKRVAVLLKVSERTAAQWQLQAKKKLKELKDAS